MQQKKVWDPESTSAFWINRASRLLLRLHESRLRPLGFGMNQMPALIALSEADALSQKELAQVARVEQPTMAEMLARLERDGIIDRTPNPEDRRGALVSMTKAARTRMPQAKAALLRGEDDATRGLTKAEKAQLLSLLQRVVGNIQNLDGA